MTPSSCPSRLPRFVPMISRCSKRRPLSNLKKSPRTPMVSIRALVSKFPLFDEDGKPYALCGITTDITWRKTGRRHCAQATPLPARSSTHSPRMSACWTKKGSSSRRTTPGKSLLGNTWMVHSSPGKSRTIILTAVVTPLPVALVTGQAILKGVEDVLAGRERVLSMNMPVSAGQKNAGS